MTSSKKTLSALLLCATLLTSIVSCSSGKNSDATDSGNAAAETASDASGETTAAETTVEETISDDIPQLDFEGYKFQILAGYANKYCVPEATGDVLNDAIYKRQLSVGERFNCEISATDVSADLWSDLYDAFRTSVLAGEDTYDVYVPHLIGACPGLVMDHMVMDWNTVKYIDLTKPWWNQTVNQTLNLLGKQYYITGDIVTPSPFCMFFNKKFIDSYGLEDMYTVINEGRWTLDKFAETTRAISEDIDGDGAFTISDQYGCTFNNDNQVLNFMFASDIQSVILDDNGKPTPNINTERMQTLTEKVYDIIYNGNGTYYSKAYEDNETQALEGFRDGRIFIRAGVVGNAITMRDFDVDFGIIPYPMFDEEQDGYYTYVAATYGAPCLPVTAEDPDRTGAIVEALAAESYSSIMPTYYDIALGTKYLRDAESVEMLDVIYDGIIYDFGFVFDNWNGCTWALPRMMTDKKTNVEAYWATIESSVVAWYDKLYEAVNEQA